MYAFHRAARRNCHVIRRRQRTVLFSVPRYPFCPFSNDSRTDPLSNGVPRLNFNRDGFLRRNTMYPTFFRLFRLVLRFCFHSLRSQRFNLRLLRFRVVLFMGERTFLHVTMSVRRLLTTVSLFVRGFLTLRILFLLLLRHRRLMRLNFNLYINLVRRLLPLSVELDGIILSRFRLLLRFISFVLGVYDRTFFRGSNVRCLKRTYNRFDSYRVFGVRATTSRHDLLIPFIRNRA